MATDNVPAFHYDVLPSEPHHVRLLRLLPLSGAHIQVSLDTFAHDTCPEYEAVSYAWGPPTDINTILVNGGTLEIRRNLWHFLDIVSRGQLRHPEEELFYRPHFLWIDQISINQSLTLEKNHQVQQMASIFKRASRVIMWVGPGCEGEQDVLRRLFVAKAAFSVSENDLDRSCDEGLTLRSQEKELLEKELDAFSTLFSQPYWTRLWTVQEMLLAKSRILGFGHYCMDWFELFKFKTIFSLWNYASCIDVPRDHALSNTVIRDHLWAMGGYEPLPADLCSVLNRYSSLACEDPRDKVFGLLALVRSGDVPAIDYSRPPSEVFWTAIAVLRTDIQTYSLRDSQMVAFLGPLASAMGVTGFEPNAISFTDFEAEAVWHPSLRLVWPGQK